MIWRAEGGSTAAGPWYSRARAINDQGSVAANTYSPNTRALLWRNGVTTRLGTLGGAVSQGVAPNERDHVIGTSTTAGGATHSFLWRDGQMIDLGTLGGATTTAVAVNDRDQVVGTSETATGEKHAFLWQDGSMIDLGTPGDASAATDINERGQIVGTIRNWQQARIWAVS